MWDFGHGPICQQNKVEFQTKSKFYADIAELTVGDEKVLLVKPTTYYNDTGKAALAPSAILQGAGVATLSVTTN